jgi:ABC-type molybdate transport system substrate-binding protein
MRTAAGVQIVLLMFSCIDRQAQAQGQEIRVAAAGDLKFAMGELTENFEKRTGTKGSSRR